MDSTWLFVEMGQMFNPWWSIEYNGGGRVARNSFQDISASHFDIEKTANNLTIDCKSHRKPFSSKSPKVFFYIIFLFLF